MLKWLIQELKELIPQEPPEAPEWHVGGKLDEYEEEADK